MTHGFIQILEEGVPTVRMDVASEGVAPNDDFDESFSEKVSFTL